MVGEDDREKELRSRVLVAFDLTSSTDCITYRHYHCTLSLSLCICKAGIMTSEDMINAYNDQWINLLDPLLAHLLKASQDKKFVCEAAEKALVAMTTLVSPALLLPQLQPYFKTRNPQIPAKSSMCFCRSVLRLLSQTTAIIGLEGIKACGIDKLIQTAASQLCDEILESREATRVLLLELEIVYK
ncbi:hypothetical protein SAY86_006549 [Trapa natans]|uniref:Uncharacterized protein n=1 Tax=Trapa natans TaxID=22666 RepID=A0AAN7L4Q6_TRANT|nr:hypothetical protein SAY86_006549 [Trapa natans]